MKIYKTIEQAIAEWDAEESMNPFFYFKHAIRLQGLQMGQDGQIFDSRGKLYATLGEVKWREHNILEATIKLAGGIDFIMTSIDIGKLK